MAGTALKKRDERIAFFRGVLLTGGIIEPEAVDATAAALAARTTKIWLKDKELAAEMAAVRPAERTAAAPPAAPAPAPDSTPEPAPQLAPERAPERATEPASELPPAPALAPAAEAAPEPAAALAPAPAPGPASESTSEPVASSTPPEAEPAASPAFDPFAFSAVAVMTRQGREGLLRKLEDIVSADDLKQLADAQHLTIDRSLDDLSELREAIVKGVVQRIADRRAAAS